MRTRAVAALSMLIGVVLVGCAGSGQDSGTATRTADTGAATLTTETYASASSYVTETLPTDEPSETDDAGPVILVAGPTLDDAFPADRGRFFEPEQRCAWLSNPNPRPVTIDHVAIVNQQPSPSFELGPTSQELCAESESGFIVDRETAHYGQTCDGVELAPSESASDPEQKDDSCAVMVAFDGTSGTNWSADLRLELSTTCTDTTSEPCNQLEVAPSPDQPVTVGWAQIMILGACLVDAENFPTWPECRLDQSVPTGDDTGSGATTTS